MAITTTEPGLLRLLQLASVSLPVGGFSFSQGMEYAVDSDWIKNKEAVADWLRLQLLESLARLDLALLFRFYKALQDQDLEAISEWNNFIIASRETSELRLTDVAMGQALLRLLPTLDVPVPLAEGEEASFVTGFAIASRHWGLSVEACAMALAWSWLENQVAAATKLVPLGQTQAQQLLSELQADIPAAIALAESLPDDELGSSLPALAIASSLHETQYSRLFRS